MTQQQVMDDLADPRKPIRHADLMQLSGMARSEAAGVMSSWVGVSAARKSELIERMVEMAEENIELDFSGVLRACLRDAHAGVREKAALGLWDSDDRSIVRPLVELLGGDPSSSVRAAAATTLAKFAEMAGEGRMTKRDVQRIRGALLAVIEREDEEIETRRRAIESVAAFDSDRVRSIISQAYGDADVRLKQSAIYAMGRSSDERWLPTVLRETRSEDAAMRFEAATACGLLGDDDMTPHLINMLNDEDSQVQLAVVRALGVIGGDLARRALMQAIRLGDDAVEEAAEEALALIEFDEDPLGLRVD